MLRSPEDSALIRAARQLALQAGATHAQFQALLAAHDEGVAHGLAGAALKTWIGEDPVISRFAPELAAKLDRDVFTPILERGIEAAPPEPTPEQDGETIMKAEALLKSDATAYFRDDALQQEYSEALERRSNAPAPAEPTIDHMAIERDRAQRDVEKFEQMMRDPAGYREYWRSPALQAEYGRAIERQRRSNAPAPAEPTIDHMAIERDRAQRDVEKFEQMMRDPAGYREYWRSPALQAEYGRAIERQQAGEVAMAAGDGLAPASLAEAAPPAAPVGE